MRILFFTPFAQRNGAEMMLWYILNHIDKEKFSCAIYSNYDGELFSDLPDSIQYFVPPPVKPITLSQRIRKRIGDSILNKKKQDSSYKNLVTSIHDEFKPDIWYINTILCPEAVELACELKVPYVVHFHDLLFLYQHVTYNSLKQAVENASLLVGCSTVVCDKLRIMGGSNIALQYECIDINKIVVNEGNANRIRKDLGLSDSFVWIMSGSIEYRKGTDLIPEIARLLGKSITILWVGPGSSGYSYYVEQELKYYGLNNVHILGSKSKDYYDYLSLADGLVLTSREDPFPLVMIEAAAMGKPIVSFNSGGVSEFMQENMGVVVDSFDVETLVSAMEKVQRDEVNFNRDAAIKRAKEFDAQMQAVAWQSMILDNSKLRSQG